MAFRAVIRGLGLLFYILLEFQVGLTQGLLRYAPLWVCYVSGFRALGDYHLLRPYPKSWDVPLRICYGFGV